MELFHIRKQFGGYSSYYSQRYESWAKVIQNTVNDMTRERLSPPISAEIKSSLSSNAKFGSK